MLPARTVVTRLLCTAILAALTAFSVVLGVSTAEPSVDSVSPGLAVQGRSDIVQSDAAARELQQTAIRTAPRVVEQRTAAGALEQPAGQLLPGMTTPFARTYRQDDGSLVSRVSATPVDYQDGQGDWQRSTIRWSLMGLACGSRPIAMVCSCRGRWRWCGECRVRIAASRSSSRARRTRRVGEREHADTVRGRVARDVGGYPATPRGVSETLVHGEQ